MAGLLIWIPQLDRAPDADELRELGLGWLEPTGHSSHPSPGPAGEAGRLIALEPSTPAGKRARCRYRIGQEWHDTGRYWFGWDRDDPPRPVDLQRPILYFGHPARLGDEQDWTVPIVRPYTAQRFRLAADGETWLTPMPDDYELVAGCVRYWDWRWGGAEPVSRSDIVNLCVRALSVHYRLDRPQCSALGLFDDRAIDKCLGAMFDVPSMAAELRARKKNDDAAADEPDTAAAGSIATGGCADSATGAP